MKKKKSVFFPVFMVLMFLFMYAPIVLLMIFSFNNSKSRSVWHGFSMKWYLRLLKDDTIIHSLQVTVAVSLLAALFATILGTLAAIGIFNMPRRRRRLMMTANNVPMMNPDIILGVSLMLMFIFMAQTLHLYMFRLGFLTLLIAHITFDTPYVILSVMPRLRQIDIKQYEAARDLGASVFQAYRYIIFPQILPGVITGAILSFTLSIDDVVVSYFTSGPTTETLGVIIFGMTRRHISPEINALCTLMFIVVLVLLLVINFRELKNAKEGEAS